VAHGTRLHAPARACDTLGLTPGTYDWTWGTGNHADRFTVQIGPAATGVPLPKSAWAALASLPLVLAFTRRRASVA
jgi:hypothetical protein